MRTTKATHGGKRAGAGRPPEADKRKQRAIAMTDAEWAKISAAAKAEGISISEYIRKKTL